MGFYEKIYYRSLLLKTQPLKTILCSTCTKFRRKSRNGLCFLSNTFLQCSSLVSPYPSSSVLQSLQRSSLQVSVRSSTFCSRKRSRPSCFQVRLPTSHPWALPLLWTQIPWTAFQGITLPWLSVCLSSGLSTLS